MAKYDLEFKMKIIQEYLESKGGLGYLANKYNIKSSSQIKTWINSFREFGEEGLYRKQKNQHYSVQFKMDAIELYQTTEMSYREVANHLELITFECVRYATSIVKEEQYRALQHLTRTRLQIVEQLVEAKQHFIENIYYKCNRLPIELKAGGSTTSVLSATLVSLMTEDYSLDQLAQMPLEDFAALIQKMGRGCFKNPENTAKAITKAIRGSYRLGKVQQDSVDIVLSVIAREIRRLEQLIKELDQADSITRCDPS